MASPRNPLGNGSDRVALVTGAASGIGSATAIRLAEEGIGGLVLVDRDDEGVRRLASALALPPARVLHRAHDVADEQAWEATRAGIAERFGRLDLAVANAGVAAGGRIVDTPLQEWRRIMATNLDGAFL